MEFSSLLNFRGCGGGLQIGLRSYLDFACSNHSGLDPSRLISLASDLRSPPVDFYHHILDFDSTLGFPGEGPSFSWILYLACAAVFLGRSHGMQPRNRDDLIRAEKRRSELQDRGKTLQVLMIWRIVNQKHW